MDTTVKSDHSHASYKNEHGNYPKWMSKKKVQKIKKIDKKKKNTKKSNQKKSKVWLLLSRLEKTTKLQFCLFFSRMGTKTVEDAPNLSAVAPSIETKKFKVLTSTDQIKELQTIIRDKETNR